MISFSYPLFLSFLLVFPVYYILLRMKVIQQTQLELSLMNWNSKPMQMKAHIKILYATTKIMKILGTILLIFVVARPVVYESKKVFTGTGNSVMFILDVSPSMAANDMDGETRLSSAKSVIKSFVEKNNEHSFGLTTLGSTAAMLIPPTMDHNTFLKRLDSLQAGELGNGSAIGMGIATATVHTVKSDESKSYIVLLTDGENNTGEIHPEVAVKVASRKDILLYVIGLGKTGYSEVEYTDPNTQEKISGTLYTDFDESELKKIAALGNGHYAFAYTPEELSNVFKNLTSEIPPSPAGFNITVEKSLTSFFLKVILLLFCVAWIIKRLILGALI